ncbi:hypothetical protein GCM10010339_78290 [Streptomyces alanosinicus]|uniref:Uncharacterized protein n=1 Tax=Streptomyces alanosinicus TaxID=68171 RepID=A0A919D6W0_9ACTN|nr:hypothetical protein GCM10010339_78290 [Streptomyces alanosinicus]
MAVIGNVAASRYHELVASSLYQVEVHSAAQWALARFTIESRPMNVSGTMAAGTWVRSDRAWLELIEAVGTPHRALQHA